MAWVGEHAAAVVMTGARPQLPGGSMPMDRTTQTNSPRFLLK
jgi:hypothetical protein